VSGNRADGGPALDAQDRQDEGPVLDTSVAHPARVYDYWLGLADASSKYALWPDGLGVASRQEPFRGLP